jgi:hypothetical protein
VEGATASRRSTAGSPITLRSRRTASTPRAAISSPAAFRLAVTHASRATRAAAASWGRAVRPAAAAQSRGGADMRARVTCAHDRRRRVSLNVGGWPRGGTRTGEPRRYIRSNVDGLSPMIEVSWWCPLLRGEYGVGSPGKNGIRVEANVLADIPNIVGSLSTHIARRPRPDRQDIDS